MELSRLSRVSRAVRKGLERVFEALNQGLTPLDLKSRPKLLDRLESSSRDKSHGLREALAAELQEEIRQLGGSAGEAL